MNSRVDDVTTDSENTTDDPPTAVDPHLKRIAAAMWIRSMDSTKESGGSEPHLFQADDSKRYMVKTRSCPQGPFVALNELIGGLLLDWLGVKRPATVLIDIPQALLDVSPNAKFQNGASIGAGPAFGSEFWQSEPGGQLAKGQFSNLDVVAGTMVFDTWIQNHDGRQFRERISPDDSNKIEFIPLDQGHSFGCPWTADSLRAASVAVTVATPIAPVSAELVRPYIDRLALFSNADATGIVLSMPADWLNDDQRSALIHYVTQRAALAVVALRAAFP